MFALAVLTVSTASFAQSSVTIGGTLDVGPMRTTKLSTQNADSDTTTTVKGSNLGQASTWATSVLSISGVEDLGGGLKASAVMISAVGDGFAARERTLGLSGNFGALRFGRFVPAAAAGFYAFTGSGSATLVGSIYGMSTASGALSTDRATGIGGATGIDGSTRNNLHDAYSNFERQDNVLQYTSPTISGFTANLAMVNNSSDSNASDSAGKVVGKQTSIHLGYAAGPLSAGIGFNTRTDGTEKKSGSSAAATFVDGNTDFDSELRWVGVSYNLGFATVYATNVHRHEEWHEPRGTPHITYTDATVNAFGVMVPMGALTLRASTYSGKDKQSAGTGDDTKLSGYQLSAVYALSKRTAIVAATGHNHIDRDGASGAATRQITGTTLTVNHTF